MKIARRCDAKHIFRADALYPVLCVLFGALFGCVCLFGCLRVPPFVGYYVHPAPSGCKSAASPFAAALGPDGACLQQPLSWPVFFSRPSKKYGFFSLARPGYIGCFS